MNLRGFHEREKNPTFEYLPALKGCVQISQLRQHSASFWTVILVPIRLMVFARKTSLQRFSNFHVPVFYLGGVMLHVQLHNITILHLG
jgi:hypothetical protein